MAECFAIVVITVFPLTQTMAIVRIPVLLQSCRGSRYPAFNPSRYPPAPKKERREEWHKLVGHYFLSAVTNGTPMSWTVFLGCSTCPPRRASRQGDPFSPRSTERAAAAAAQEGREEQGPPPPQVADMARFVSFSTAPSGHNLMWN